MKSLIKKGATKTVPESAAKKAVVEPKVAQCCAKVSKVVAGCHD